MKQKKYGKNIDIQNVNAVYIFLCGKYAATYKSLNISNFSSKVRTGTRYVSSLVDKRPYILTPKVVCIPNAKKPVKIYISL